VRLAEKCATARKRVQQITILFRTERIVKKILTYQIVTDSFKRKSVTF